VVPDRAFPFEFFDISGDLYKAFGPQCRVLLSMVVGCDGGSDLNSIKAFVSQLPFKV
jgi:hypothetical protein